MFNAGLYNYNILVEPFNISNSAPSKSAFIKVGIILVSSTNLSNVIAWHC